MYPFYPPRIIPNHFKSSWYTAVLQVLFNAPHAVKVIEENPDTPIRAEFLKVHNMYMKQHQNISDTQMQPLYDMFMKLLKIPKNIPCHPSTFLDKAIDLLGVTHKFQFYAINTLICSRCYKLKEGPKHGINIHASVKFTFYKEDFSAFVKDNHAMAKAADVGFKCCSDDIIDVKKILVPGDYIMFTRAPTEKWYQYYPAKFTIDVGDETYTYILKSFINIKKNEATACVYNREMWYELFDNKLEAPVNPVTLYMEKIIYQREK